MLICRAMSHKSSQNKDLPKSEKATKKNPESEPEEDYSHLEPKIYLLPNLMTAGNLLCGFLAVLSIFEGMHGEITGLDKSVIHDFYEKAIFFIFGSCLFDLLDGRLARLGGQESPFGREFDSIADVISFGMAPALLISRAVLFNLPEEISWIAWFVSFSYLLCGAMRLARFNCLAAIPKKPDDTDFLGIPIPMAAGFIASMTFLLSNFYEVGKDLGAWNYVLVGVMLGLSVLMISSIKYPSFKKVDWRTKGSVWGILAVTLVFGLIFKKISPKTKNSFSN